MNRTKEEYLALLEDTVKYYSEDTSRRAMGKIDCEYLTEDGRKCAVGRFLVEDFGYKSFNTCTSVTDLYATYGSTDEFLIPEYRGYDIDFWVKLQQLHDTEPFWNDEGLTDEGNASVERIKELINTNVYSCIND